MEKIVIDRYASRAYTCALLQLVEEQMFTADAILRSILGYMSEDEVKDFCQWAHELRDDNNDCIITEAE